MNESPSRESSSQQMAVSTDQRHGTIEASQRTLNLEDQRDENRREIIYWQKVNNESPDFKGEDWLPYIVDKPNDHDEVFQKKKEDKDEIDKAKKVEFEVIDRYLRYLKRVYLGSESEEGIELGAPDSDGFESFKRVPNPGKIFSFAHNLERFRTHPSKIHQK